MIIIVTGREKIRGSAGFFKKRDMGFQILPCFPFECGFMQQIPGVMGKEDGILPVGKQLAPVFIETLFIKEKFVGQAAEGENESGFDQAKLCFQVAQAGLVYSSVAAQLYW